MHANDYQKLALRTANPELSKKELLTNGALGLAGEGGEVADAVKKHLFQGHELEPSKIARELGDICWYIAITSHAIGYDLDTIFQMNVDKLSARYPDGFEAERSINRKAGDD